MLRAPQVTLGGLPPAGAGACRSSSVPLIMLSPACPTRGLSRPLVFLRSRDCHSIALGAVEVALTARDAAKRAWPADLPATVDSLAQASLCPGPQAVLC